MHGQDGGEGGQQLLLSELNTLSGGSARDDVTGNPLDVDKVHIARQVEMEYVTGMEVYTPLPR